MSELRAAKTLEQLKEIYDNYPQCHPPEGITLAQPEHSAAAAEAKPSKQPPTPQTEPAPSSDPVKPDAHSKGSELFCTVPEKDKAIDGAQGLALELADEGMIEEARIARKLEKLLAGSSHTLS